MSVLLEYDDLLAQVDRRILDIVSGPEETRGIPITGNIIVYYDFKIEEEGEIMTV